MTSQMNNKLTLTKINRCLAQKIYEYLPQPKTNSGRIVYYDVLRLISFFYVIMIHTDFANSMNVQSRTWIVEWSILSLNSNAVGMFFMITGAVLLGRNKCTVKYTLNRTCRMIAVTIGTAFFYTYILAVDPVSVYTFSFFRQFLVSLLSSPTPFHMWFMYAYIGVMLMLPMLDKLTDPALLKYIITTSVILTGGYGLIQFFFELGEIPYFFDSVNLKWIMLVLCGYLLSHNKTPPISISIFAYLITTAGRIFTIIIPLLHQQTDYPLSNILYSKNYSIGLFIQTTALFCIVKWLFERISVNEKIGSLLSYLGSLTFIGYLLHVWIIGKVSFVYQILSQAGVHRIVSIMVYHIVVFVVCLIVATCIKCIPIFRKL